MSKKIRDLYPITDVYLLEMNAVDAATVTVGDLCERLSNDFETGWGFGGPAKEMVEEFKKKMHQNITLYLLEIQQMVVILFMLV